MCVTCLTWRKPGGEPMFDDTWAALASVTAHVTETAARSPPLDFVLRDLEVIGQRRGSSGCVQVYRPKISRGPRDRATVVVKRPRKSTEYYVDNAFALLAEVAVHRAIASRLHGSWAENLFAKMLGCERTRMTRSAKPPEYRVAYEAMDGGPQVHGETVRTFLTEAADKGGYRSDEEVGLVLVQLACVVRLLAESFGVLHGDLSAVNMYVQRGGEREDALVLRLIDCGWSQMAVDRESNSSSWMAGVAAHVNEATGVGWLGSHQLAYVARKQWQSDGGKMGVHLKTKRTLRALGLEDQSKTGFRSGHCCDASLDTLVAREIAIFWGNVACLTRARPLPRMDSAEVVWHLDYEKVREVLFVQLAGHYTPDRDGLYRAMFSFKHASDITHLKLGSLGTVATARSGLLLLLPPKERYERAEVWDAAARWVRSERVPKRVRDAAAPLLDAWFSV